MQHTPFRLLKTSPIVFTFIRFRLIIKTAVLRIVKIEHEYSLRFCFNTTGARIMSKIRLEIYFWRHILVSEVIENENNKRIQMSI